MIYVVYFASAGVPAMGLTPSIVTYIKVSDGTSGGSIPSISELSGGFYKFTTTPSEALLVRIDGGASLANADRYKVMQVTANDGALDAAVSTRAPEAAGNVAAIKAKTDNLPASPAAVGSAMVLTSAYDAAKTAAAESGGNLAAVKAKTDNLPASPAAAGDIPSAATIASTVWGNATRTLTSFGTLVADIWAYATRTLSSFGTLAADVWSVATRSLTDKTGFTISGTKQTLDALHDLSQAGAQAGATAALNAYDPPTKAEMDAALAALNDITVGEILNGDLSDSLSFPANSLADRLRKLFWILCNRMAIVDATGAFTAYKGDGVTPGATGTITDNGTNTVRSTPTWP
jgi:hypothetical protein